MYYTQKRFQAIYDTFKIKSILYELNHFNKIIRINHKCDSVYNINLKNQKCKIINKNINHCIIAFENLKNVFENYERDIIKNYELVREIKDESVIEYNNIKNSINYKKYDIIDLIEKMEKLTEFIYKKYQNHNFVER